MPKFKFDNCTSKQYVREMGWIPEALRRLQQLAAKSRRPETVRRLRYLTFCAEGALDVKALRNANVIKKSKDDLYDTVVFFDFAPQAVDKTLAIIEGATGFPIDFFKLMELDYDDALDVEQFNEMPKDEEEGDVSFGHKKEAFLYAAFREAFPFDLINLDVERYVIIPSEELPGRLLTAWDKLLEWQKRARKHAGKSYRIDQFTLFFTTKIGPRNLPDSHKRGLISALNENVVQFPDLKEILKARFATENVGTLYDENFDEFLKLTVPKALVSRALRRDWMLDLDLSYRAFEFRRQPPKIEPYTMLHYVLHFRRCSPAVSAQINPQGLPDAIRIPYGATVERVLSTDCEDVDQLKVPLEAKLRDSLRALGVTEFAQE